MNEYLYNLILPIYEFMDIKFRPLDPLIVTTSPIFLYPTNILKNNPSHHQKEREHPHQKGRGPQRQIQERLQLQEIQMPEALLRMLLQRRLLRPRLPLLQLLQYRGVQGHPRLSHPRNQGKKPIRLFLQIQKGRSQRQTAYQRV